MVLNTYLCVEMIDNTIYSAQHIKDTQLLKGISVAQEHILAFHLATTLASNN